LESYFCAANVHFTGVDTQDLKQMWFSPEEKERYLVKQGDLLVVEGGAGAGGCAVYNHETENIYVQNSIMIVRSKENSDNRYLKYWLESLVRRGYIDFVCNKATIPHFTKEKLSNVPFPVFTLNEQQNVADYLDNRCAQIDSLIAEKETLISDLEAYKKSLIFEVVTGKRKVV
jgi:type I restriction enzyme S subunit